jgi:hypothetical protein
MTTTQRISLLIAAVLVSLAAAAPASATIWPRPKKATYRLTVRGTQVTTWHLRDEVPSGACRLYTQGDGDQTIRFQNALHDTVDVVKDEFSPPEFTSNVALKATAERSAEQRSNRPASFSRTGCLKTVDNPVYPYPGCGSRQGVLNLELDFGTGGHIHMRGTDPAYGGKILGGTYPTCPLMVDRPGRDESAGGLLEAIQRIPVADMFGRAPKKRIAVHADATYRFTIPYGSGKTIVTYNLTLVRVSGT